MKQFYLIAAILCFSSLNSNSFAQEHNHGGENHTPAQPIVKIMQDMNENLAKLSSAIMLEDYALITLSAHNIANHPKINNEDIDNLFKRLGPEKEAFIQCDETVHNLAIKVAKAGKKRDMEEVLEEYSDMIANTTKCHQKYRNKN